MEQDDVELERKGCISRKTRRRFLGRGSVESVTWKIKQTFKTYSHLSETEDE